MTRFRHSSAIIVAGLIAAIGAVPLASYGGLYLLVLIPPLLLALWAWRAGTDADARGLQVHGALGSRQYSWPQVHELVPDERGRVSAVLIDGRTVSLTAVRAADLRRLVEASGRGLPDAGTETLPTDSVSAQ